MKKLLLILPLALVLCFMVGCQEKVAMAELEEQNTAETLPGQSFFARTLPNVLSEPRFAYLDPLSDRLLLLSLSCLEI